MDLREAIREGTFSVAGGRWSEAGEYHVRGTVDAFGRDGSRGDEASEVVAGGFGGWINFHFFLKNAVPCGIGLVGSLGNDHDSVT